MTQNDYKFIAATLKRAKPVKLTFPDTQEAVNSRIDGWIDTCYLLATAFQDTGGTRFDHANFILECGIKETNVDIIF